MGRRRDAVVRGEGEWVIVMPFGLSFIGVLYGAALISPYDLDAYRYIYSHAAYTFYVVKHTCPRYSCDPPISPPLPFPFSVPPIVHQGKHSNAKLVFENIEWLVVWGRRMDGHVFPRKSANRFREGNFCWKKKMERVSSSGDVARMPYVENAR